MVKMKAFSALACLMLLASCATAPKVKPPDPWATAEIAIAAAVTIDPELKPYVLKAVIKAEEMVDKDVGSALGILLDEFKETRQYSALIVSSLRVLMRNSEDLKLKPEVIEKTKVLLADLKTILE